MVDTMFLIICIFVSILGLGVLILVHELGHFIAAKRSGVGVTEFSLGFWKKLWGFKRGETEYKISVIPIGGYVKMMGLESEECDDPNKSYANKPKLTRLKILAAGVTFNFLFAMILLTLVNMHGVRKLKPVINVTPDTPAAEVLVSGDEIRNVLISGDYSNVNGVEVEDWESLTAELQKSQGRKIRLIILRNGAEKEVNITPVKREVEDEFGGKVEKWMIGIAPAGIIFTASGMSPAKAFIESIKTSGKAYKVTYTFLWRLFTKKAKAEKGLGGPVLIIAFMTAALKDGLYSFVSFLALMSLMLCIMNSMPIPVLDGGHIMFLGVEAIRGKPLSKKVMNKVQYTFFYLLITLMLFVTYLDLGKLLP